MTSLTRKPDWSILIPLLNEQATLEPLCNQLAAVAKANDKLFEIVLVDDGSTDGSWEVIEQLASTYDYIYGIRFRRNFGKAAALSAGLQQCSAPIIITMDADLQDEPQELPKLVAKLGEGFDCVSGWKKERQDPWHKRWPSLGFNALVNWITGLKLHDHNCGLKAYRREALDEIQLYGEMHRFIPALVAARGFRVTELAVHHSPRQHGVSKYGWTRLPKGFLDLMTVSLLTGYRQRPSHLLGSIGLTSLLFGGLSLSWLTLWWFLSRTISGDAPIHLHQRAIFYYAMAAIIVGVQLVVMGILAELIIATQRTASAPYAISEKASRKSNGGLMNTEPMALATGNDPAASNHATSNQASPEASAYGSGTPIKESSVDG
jgi:glycosyltransferase involved in cell wall biosynthesis